jgi:pimeloyl-ACP methyl ester carboxylesterase
MNAGARTRYARSGDVHIAYQVIGEGPLDLVLVPGFVSHVEYIWEEPRAAHFLKRLASFARLILFDKRGTGLSDRGGPVPTLEQRMDDVRAVMDAAGSARAAVLGVSEGGPMGLLFAATYPDRASALVIHGSFARAAWAPDHPFGNTAEELDQFTASMERGWGGPWAVKLYAPSLADDKSFRQWWAAFLRQSASPGSATALARMSWEIDVRHVLPAIRIPTLILHTPGDLAVRVEQGRYLAEHIPGARYFEAPGADHLFYAGQADVVLGEIEEFLTGTRNAPEPDRVLATVLFCDIVGSTEQAVALGDHRWRELLQQYYALVRRELGRFRGREIDTAGDGVLAAFDGPARAIGCGRQLAESVGGLGLRVRVGLHTGECDRVDDKLSGVAVHIGARVASLAAPGEVLVSNTVKDLVAGSGLTFEDRGAHVLKGVPGEWRLHAVGVTR